MRWTPNESPELSPDLEWMLQSGQADGAMLAEALVSEFSTPLFRLAIALLEDEGAARAAVQVTIQAAVADAARYRPAQSVQTWLFRRALGTVRQARRWLWLERRLPKSPNHHPLDKPGNGSPGWTGSALWEAVKTLPERTQLAVLLRGLLGWEVKDIAPVLGQSESQVRTCLEAAWRRLPGPAEGDAEYRLAQALQVHWPSQENPFPSVKALAAAAVRQDRHRLRQVALGELLWIALAIAALLGLTWSSRPYAPGPTFTPQPLNTPTLSPTSTPDFSVNYYAQPGESLRSIAAKTGVPIHELARINPISPEAEFKRFRLVLLPEPPTARAPTAIPALAEGPSPLTGSSQPAEVLQRLAGSQRLWRTLWADAQLVRYGPPGYVGPPQTYRSQVWISQPDQSIQLVGPVSGRPIYRLLTRGQYVYFHGQGHSYSWFSEAPDLLNGWSALPGLIFPGEAEWLQRPGDFQVVERTETAGRPAVAVDWINAAGQRERRLWVDAQTGVVLRQREFGGEAQQTVLADYSITAIQYDANFPAELFDPRQSHIRYAQDYLGVPLVYEDPVQLPTLAAPVARAPLTHLPAPAGFEPARSRLTFQYPDNPTRSEADPIVELFADGFYLGSFPFTDPWNVLCARSPDGLRLAFTSKPGRQQMGIQIAVNLHWFQITDLEIHSPAEPIEASSFAFAPDSRRLAVFGYRASKAPGVDLIDTEGGQVSRLIDLTLAESLIWSPDGEQLALIGKRPGLRAFEVLVVHTISGQILFQTPVDPDDLQRALEQPAPNSGWPSPNWPGSGWELKFPVRMGELEACSAGPGTRSP